MLLTKLGSWHLSVNRMSYATRNAFWRKKATRCGKKFFHGIQI